MHLTHCFFVFLLTSICFAQEARPVSCRFIGFGLEANEKVLSANPKGDPIPCDLPVNKLSPKTQCFAVGTSVNFISPVDRKSLVATATIPASGNSFIFIFLKKPQPKDPKIPNWNIFVIEDTEKKFFPGGTYVVNFHQKDIRFNIGEHKGMLRPGMSSCYPLPNKKNDFNMAQVFFEHYEEQKWLPMKESGYRCLPDIRYIAVGYMSPKTKRPELQIIEDIKQTVIAP